MKRWSMGIAALAFAAVILIAGLTKSPAATLCDSGSQVQSGATFCVELGHHAHKKKSRRAAERRW